MGIDAGKRANLIDISDKYSDAVTELWFLLNRLRALRQQATILGVDDPEILTDSVYTDPQQGQVAGSRGSNIRFTAGDLRGALTALREIDDWLCLPENASIFARALKIVKVR